MIRIEILLEVIKTIKCSLASQISNFRILSIIKIRKFLDRVVEHSSRLITFSIQEQLEFKNMLNVKGFQLIISKLQRLFNNRTNNRLMVGLSLITHLTRGIVIKEYF